MNGRVGVGIVFSVIPEIFYRESQKLQNTEIAWLSCKRSKREEHIRQTQCRFLE